jgi:hypothetical protein
MSDNLKSNWINISDKKPEEGQNIMAIFKHGIIDCSYDAECNVGRTYIWRDFEFYIHSWMPLELANDLLAKGALK